MADGLIEDPFGGEDEAGEAAGGRLDPTAAALAAAATPANPNLAAAAESYFRRQERLIEIQTEHLHEQRALLLAHLRLRLAGDWFRTVGQLLIGLVAAGFTTAIALMLYDAVTSRSVVVEAFDAPPALAPKGVNGKVIAGGVVDALQTLANATRTTEKALATHNAWSSDIQVEVPETGVSIGQIDRLLHQRLGRDLYIGGDLVQTDSGGMALTVRGDDVPPRPFPAVPATWENSQSRRRNISMAPRSRHNSRPISPPAAATTTPWPSYPVPLPARKRTSNARIWRPLGHCVREPEKTFAGRVEIPARHRTGSRQLDAA